MPRRTKAEIEAAKLRSEKAWQYRLKKVYGLSPEEYWALYAAQGGKCFVHNCRANGRTKRLAVEHDHATGFIRGLACSRHNTWLGQASDDPLVFQSMMFYLDHPPAFAVIGQRPVPSV